MSIDWPRLYAAHAPDLQRYLARLTADSEAGADLMQECFVRGLRSEQSIRDQRAVRAWLFRTGTNLARNERRRRALLRFLPFTGLEPSLDEGFDPAAAQVRAAFRSLPFEQATALLLRYESGFPRSEIAAMLGLSEETVKSRLSRGRKNFIAAYRRLDRGLAR